MEETPDPKMLAVLEILLNQDILENETDWDLIEALVPEPPKKPVAK